MALRARQARPLLIAAAVAATLVGCVQTFPMITVPSTAPVSPAPDHASIVIIQPTTRMQLNILDARGQLVAQVNDRSRTVVRVPPGAIRVYAVPGKFAEAGDRIEGSVKGGRTYYATISVRGGGYGGVAFRALNPRSHDDRWSQRDAYIAKTTLIEMDPSKVGLVARELGDTGPLLQKVDAKIEKLGPEHRAERTIDPDDGL